MFLSQCIGAWITLLFFEAVAGFKGSFGNVFDLRALISAVQGVRFLADHKIAFSHYSAPGDIGGVTTWLERLVMRLSHDGHRPVVLLHHHGLDIHRSTILGPLLDAGVHVEIRPRSSTLAGDVRDTLEFLNRHRPHVFLPQCHAAMYLAAAYAGRRGLPWVMTLHSDDRAYWVIARAVPPEKRGGVLVGVSKRISQVALARGVASSPRTIPCGVPLRARSATFSKTPFRVAFSGRLEEEQKRISLVIAAMIEACRLDRRVECVVLGHGPAQDAAIKLVSDCNLSQRIRFLGRLTPADVQTELVKCQALLLMSDFEGLPLALLEAMAVGVVPVARAIPSGIPELVLNRKTGLLVDEDPQNAAAAILKLAHDPALWSKCSRGAKKLVEDQFSEEISYAKWLELLDVLGSRCSVRYPMAIPLTLQFRTTALEIMYPGIVRGYSTLRSRMRGRVAALRVRLKLRTRLRNAITRFAMRTSDGQ